MLRNKCNYQQTMYIISIQVEEKNIYDMEMGNGSAKTRLIE